MPKISEEITELTQQLILEEQKIDKGNYSAGTRARKLLIEIIKVCKIGRDEIQQKRAAEAQA